MRLEASVKFKIINNKYDGESEEKRNWLEDTEFDIRISQEDFEKIVSMTERGCIKQNQVIFWQFEDAEDICDILDTHYNIKFRCVDKREFYREFDIRNAIFEKGKNDIVKITVVGEVKSVK